MELNEAFGTALEFEKKGKSIYEETAKKTKNPIVKKTFDYLAKQEVFHVKEIENYLKKHGGKIDLGGDGVKDTEKFFSMTVKGFEGKAALSDDDLKAHETALELEQNAYDFYKELYESAENNDLKNFFKWLMEQENAHYTLVQNAYEYVKDPVSFFSKEERWMVDGG